MALQDRRLRAGDLLLTLEISVDGADRVEDGPARTGQWLPDKHLGDGHLVGQMKSSTVVAATLLTSVSLTVRDQGDVERVIDPIALESSTPKSNAVLVALLLHPDGIDYIRLDRAMNASPLWSNDEKAQAATKGAVQHQVTLARKTGLNIVFHDTLYRVEGLDPRRIDAYRFKSLHSQIQNHRGVERGDAYRRFVRPLCAEAVAIWRWDGDPAERLGSFCHLAELGSFKRYYVRVHAEYVNALLLEGQPVSDDDLALAKASLEEIESVDPDFDDISSLADRYARCASRPLNPISSGLNNEQRHQQSADWMPRYRQYLESRLQQIDLTSFGAIALETSPADNLYTDLFVAPGPGEVHAQGYRHRLDDVVSSTPRVLVIGDSGSGKSTYLQQCCRRLLASGDSLPLLVELIDFNESAAGWLDRRGRLPATALIDVLIEQLSRRGIHADVQSVQQICESGHVTWLLDGLNEITSPSLRRATADLIAENASMWQESSFLVTSTPVVPEHPRGLVIVRVDALQPVDVEEFLAAVSRAIYPQLDETERRSHWEPLAVSIGRSPDLRGWAGLPLYLTAIALIYFKEHRIVDSRASVLDASTSWLIEHRTPLLREFLRTEKDVPQVLNLIAYTMMTQEESPSLAMARADVLDLCARFGYLAEGCDPEDFLNAALAGGGLLEARNVGDVAMMETFRDLFAAQWIAGLTDQEQSGWWSTILPHLEEPTWRHVVQLVPACLRRLGNKRVDLFMNRLGLRAQVCHAESSRIELLGLGGSILQELVPQGYEPPTSGGWSEATKLVKQMFARPMPTVLLKSRYDAATAFGLSGDDRLQEMTTTFAWLEGGAYLMGAQSDDPEASNFDRNAAPWEAPVRRQRIASLGVRRYPITVVEFRAFVSVGAYTHDADRFWEAPAIAWRDDGDITEPLDWQEQQALPNAPVTGISWHEATAYCNWLTNELDGDYVYRLPFEVEWEYAARRGIPPRMTFHWGDRLSVGDGAEANWAGSFLRRKSPVGLFAASTTPDGIADLFGNVEEWCQDIWEPSPQEDLDEQTRRGSLERKRRSVDGVVAASAGGWSQQGLKRVVRGGSCIRFARLCRPTYRSRIHQEGRYHTVGFRPVALPRSTG